MQVILLHGLGQTASAWDGVISGLPPEYPIAAPELTEFTADECTYSALYRGFCDYCGSFSKPLLCGLSLGAVLALNYAADHPENTAGMVLIAPQFKMPKALLKLQSVLFRLMPERSFGETGYGKSEFIRLTGSMSELDFTYRLGEINCPAAVACGEKDKTNLKAARQLAELLPNAALTVIPGCGHEANIGNPAETAALIKSAANQCKE